ncbi:MAG: gamma-glutamyltransferase family protein [Actinomycetota bacterium]
MTEAKLFGSGCVASPHYLASAAGLAALADGGNALDAAIAVNLTLGVVTPYMCGYGGDLFTIIWAEGELHAYNGSGRAPAGATLDSVRTAAGQNTIPAIGPLSVTVPGAVEAWFTLIDRFGTRSFAELAAPALRLARDGFPINDLLVAHFDALGRQYSGSWGEPWRDIYTGANASRRFRQPALARTIQTLIDGGPEGYYRGEIAAAISQTLQSNGAFMSKDDLGSHHGDWVDTISSTYRDIEVHQIPPSSQGLVTLEALNIVENLDLGAAESPERHHALIEATKLALSDRDAYVTDLEHMRIDPAELVSKDWAAGRRELIDPAHASAPAAGRAAVGGTAYFCAADGDGMLVSMIQSNYKGFGSGVTVPDWGINLQDRGSFFSLDPDHVNVIAPGKRTLHTLMPAFAIRNGKPWMAFGSMGGDGQAQTQLQFLTRVVDDGRDIQDAIDAGRWVVSPDDWSVSAEARLGGELIDGLRARGHEIRSVRHNDPNFGHAHAIQVTPVGYAAAFDQRSQGAALGL